MSVLAGNGGGQAGLAIGPAPLLGGREAAADSGQIVLELSAEALASDAFEVDLVLVLAEDAVQEVLELPLAVLVPTVVAAQDGELFIVVKLRLLAVLLRRQHPTVPVVAGAGLSPVGAVRIGQVAARGGRVLLLLLDGLVLFVDEALELALLQIADQNLPLLTVVHLRELPQLVLLEDAESPEVRGPLLAQVVQLLVVLVLGGVVDLRLQHTLLRAALADADEATVHAAVVCAEIGRQAADAELPRPEALLRELDLDGLLGLFEFCLLDGEEFIPLTLL